MWPSRSTPPFWAAASIQEEVRRSSKTIHSSLKVNSSPLRLLRKLKQEFGDVTLKVHPPLTGSSLNPRGGQEVLKNHTIISQSLTSSITAPFIVLDWLNWICSELAPFFITNNHNVKARDPIGSKTENFQQWSVTSWKKLVSCVAEFAEIINIKTTQSASCCLLLSYLFISTLTFHNIYKTFKIWKII